MDKVGKPRRPRSEPRPVSDENMRRLLRTPMRRRTRAMILLASLQGLRTHEIAKVKAEHLDLIARTMVVAGKGGVTATLPLHHLVIEQAYRMPRRGFWFPGEDAGHQRRESVSCTIKEVIAARRCDRLGASVAPLVWDCVGAGRCRSAHRANLDAARELDQHGDLYAHRRRAAVQRHSAIGPVRRREYAAGRCARSEGRRRHSRSSCAGTPPNCSLRPTVWRRHCDRRAAPGPR